MYEQRQGLVIWFQSLKQVRQLRKYGHVQYVSKKLKYAMLYCNNSEAEELSESIERLPFVTHVEWSKRTQLDLNFHEEESERKKQSKFIYKAPAFE
ncbi:uncharacterized protein YlbG (UPF0298 family) [Geomicrobium halophilum]|uniref:Uncharacterized protein YlbG (UPF0298 family) n=1 Tax=Geomicrobium halophilum TaxID=549000 RepID=A0A841PQE4_9BACL|nr:YlbG family protein [Geomicrobium halophilum]MBB6449406.1 uncharacterized protein YlbG (UPF0298 family) [Geomicrobium halophilum]